jgi:hypothetical protein
VPVFEWCLFVCERRGRHVRVRTTILPRPLSPSDGSRPSFCFEFARQAPPFLTYWVVDETSQSGNSQLASGGHPSRACPLTRTLHLQSRSTSRSRPFAMQAVPSSIYSISLGVSVSECLSRSLIISDAERPCYCYFTGPTSYAWKGYSKENRGRQVRCKLMNTMRPKFRTTTCG